MYIHRHSYIRYLKYIQGLPWTHLFWQPNLLYSFYSCAQLFLLLVISSGANQVQCSLTLPIPRNFDGHQWFASCYIWWSLLAFFLLRLTTSALHWQDTFLFSSPSHFNWHILFFHLQLFLTLLQVSPWWTVCPTMVWQWEKWTRTQTYITDTFHIT